MVRRFLAAIAKLVPNVCGGSSTSGSPTRAPPNAPATCVWVTMGIVIGVPEIWAAISGDDFYWPTISTTVGHLQDRWPVLTLIPVALIVGYGYSALRLRPATTALQADMSAITRTPQGRLTQSDPTLEQLAAGDSRPRSVPVLLDPLLRRRDAGLIVAPTRRIPEPQPVPRRVRPLQPDRDLLGHHPQRRRLLVQTRRPLHHPRRHDQLPRPTTHLRRLPRRRPPRHPPHPPRLLPLAITPLTRSTTHELVQHLPASCGIPAGMWIQDPWPTHGSTSRCNKSHANA